MEVKKIILGTVRQKLYNTMIELLNNVFQIYEKHESVNIKTGKNFNLYNIIDLTRDEVRIHSKFIGELLNPKGTHGQGNLFLNLFIEQLDIKNFVSKGSIFTLEKYIGPKTKDSGGRIDIIIEDINNNSITIENKIDAEDQEAQLLRYYNYKKDNILYLTLDGCLPSKNSYKHLEVDKDFKVISYKLDIIEWLESCMSVVENYPELHEGIKHYYNLIKKLIGKSSDIRMEKEIIKLLSSSPDKLKTASLLNKHWEETKIEIQWKFWNYLSNALEATMKEFTKDDNEVTLNKVSDYYKKSRSNKFYGIYYKIYECGDLEYSYGFEIDHYIYCGFIVEKNGEVDISKNNIYDYEKDLITEKIDCNYQSSVYWLGWKYIQPELNFREFNSDTVFDLANNDFLQKITSDIVASSMNDIKVFIREVKNK